MIIARRRTIFRGGFCFYCLVLLLLFGAILVTDADDDDNDDTDDSSSVQESIALNVCDDSVVEVSYLTVLCNSPYTFYYGNGANRNSYVCDYGDKASLSIEFVVNDDLQNSDTEIYVTMAAFDDADHLLASTYPEPLCGDYVGYDCTKAGMYDFSRKLKFGTPYGSDANRTKFVPVIHMAFSTKSDSGYNLGAVNMECPAYDYDYDYSDQETAYGVVSWSDESHRTPLQKFLYTYGMLIVAWILLLGITFFVYRMSLDNPGFDHFPPYIHSRDASSEGGGEMSLMNL